MCEDKRIISFAGGGRVVVGYGADDWWPGFANRMISGWLSGLLFHYGLPLKSRNLLQAEPHSADRAASAFDLGDRQLGTAAGTHHAAEHLSLDHHRRSGLPGNPHPVSGRPQSAGTEGTQVAGTGRRKRFGTLLTLSNRHLKAFHFETATGDYATADIAGTIPLLIRPIRRRFVRWG